MIKKITVSLFSILFVSSCSNNLESNKTPIKQNNDINDKIVVKTPDIIVSSVPIKDNKLPESNNSKPIENTGSKIIESSPVSQSNSIISNTSNTSNNSSSSSSSSSSSTFVPLVAKININSIEILNGNKSISGILNVKSGDIIVVKGENFTQSLNANIGTCSTISTEFISSNEIRFKIPESAENYPDEGFLKINDSISQDKLVVTMPFLDKIEQSNNLVNVSGKNLVTSQNTMATIESIDGNTLSIQKDSLAFEIKKDTGCSYLGSSTDQYKLPNEDYSVTLQISGKDISNKKITLKTPVLNYSTVTSDNKFLIIAGEHLLAYPSTLTPKVMVGSQNLELVSYTANTIKVKLPSKDLLSQKITLDLATKGVLSVDSPNLNSGSSNISINI
ncbi:MAG: hypothetical protein AABZ74_18890 [Cyanobacteriota bacterium]